MSSIHAAPPPPIVMEPTGQFSYATGPALGKGGFAICHRAERIENNKQTGHLVALKIVKTKMEPAKLAQKFVTELQIHSKLAHPNIVAFYRAFPFETSTYVVLELCPNGSLADMLKRRGYLSLPEIRRIVVQICGAVKYLHCRHIVHRDLKTGNLFLDKNMDVKVGDFGLAALLVTEKEMEVRRRTTMCGTPNYLAPEILEKGKGHDEKVDLWAIGVIAYTLAVGKAPFHASTKEEIYKKLKSGTYTWPELNATTNQSADLRNLVASLLVPEEQRPPPDQIVSQDFFRLAWVPPKIPSSARTVAPVWSENGVPSPGTLSRGYSESWFALCMKTGVGELDGKAFRFNGGRKVRSIVHDMAVEVQLGRQPSMPLPAETVYISTINSWDVPKQSAEASRSGTLMARPRCRGTGLKEISNNEVAGQRREMAPARDAELMQPPIRPSSRAGTATIRKSARTISEETADARGIKIATEAPASHNLLVPKIRPAPISTTTLRGFVSSSAPESKSVRIKQPEVDDAPPVKRSADASLARRPRGPARSLRKVTTTLGPKPQSAMNAQPPPNVSPLPPSSMEALPQSTMPAKLSAAMPANPSAKPSSLRANPKTATTDALGPLVTLNDLAKVPPIKRSRHAVVEILSDHEEDNKPALSLPPPPSMRSKKLPVPQKPQRPEGNVAGTDPESVLQRLGLFCDNLAAALANKSTLTPAREADQLPFVVRWVDYSRKHGVGYVMSDGTIGCIVNASAKHKTPVTHVHARKGTDWLQEIGSGLEGLDKVPLEVAEDCGDAGIVLKQYGRHGPNPTEALRLKTLKVLWAKFGRYMCQSLESDELEGWKTGGNYVRFYQRVGNVGIWGFADGCFQVHFPDHTKIVLSPTGTHISATCLTTEAATYLATQHDLTAHHVSTREVYNDSVISLLHGGGRIRSRAARANMIPQKLAFILELCQQWLRNGGLGRLDGDSATVTRLTWFGPAVKDSPKREALITVGRYGGDA
ncbi:Pkinase-domain-containing protein [Piedraia hortae CBS 480.64]|uniref:Pkinase-domain-containing protein n=1 Tax=Piedraia hortae CBS 480.64 TaxID=1314780 RepID=A0A6A7BTS8_9PEZI|nr:Pkinase-domain-containing protein [Piedraia hortae CBS 480.64]